MGKNYSKAKQYRKWVESDKSIEEIAKFEDVEVATVKAGLPVSGYYKSLKKKEVKAEDKSKAKWIETELKTTCPYCQTEQALRRNGKSDRHFFHCGKCGTTIFFNRGIQVANAEYEVTVKKAEELLERIKAVEDKLAGGKPE